MRNTLIIIIALFSFGQIKAQGRVTTPEEYKYILAGDFEVAMPAHQLIKTLVSATLSFPDGSRKADVWEFFRSGATRRCCLLIVYKKNDDKSLYICVPEANSDLELWKDYRSKLNQLDGDDGALETISYVLSLYLSGH